MVDKKITIRELLIHLIIEKDVSSNELKDLLVRRTYFRLKKDVLEEMNRRSKSNPSYPKNCSI